MTHALQGARTKVNIATLREELNIGWTLTLPDLRFAGHDDPKRFRLLSIKSWQGSAAIRNHEGSAYGSKRQRVDRMRYTELTEGRPWKTYLGRKNCCLLTSPEDLGNGNCIVVEAGVSYGEVVTGRTAVHWGYFVRITPPFSGEEWLGEDRLRLLDALRQAAAMAQRSGWAVQVMGCTQEFKETGLSFNSGYGFHPSRADRHVHMLEPSPRKRDQD